MKNKASSWVNFSAVILCLLCCNLKAQVSFNLSSKPGAGNAPSSIAAADVNGDGKVDLICVNYYDNTVSVLTNNGSGGFVPACTNSVGSLPIIVTAADVNGDGAIDAICANSDGTTISVLTNKNNGSGGFVPAGDYIVGSGPRWVTSADVNGDGKVDLITANGNSNLGNTLTVLTNDGSGGFVIASSPVVGSGPDAVEAADVNGDGKVDLIAANRVDNTLTVLTNNGSGGFVLYGTNSVGSEPDSITPTDVNGDGKVDLITANWGGSSGNTLTVLTNNGSGGFVFSSTLTVGSGPLSVAAADVNGDGKVDLISANNTGKSVTVMTNNGFGGFVLATTLSVGNNANWVTAADVNGDGKVDLLVPTYPDNTISVFTNATPTCDPAPSGIVAWWPAEGNANDIIGNNNGTLLGGLGFASGKVGQAFNFTNNSNGVLVPASSNLAVQSITIEAWIYPTDISTQRPIVEFSTAGGPGMVDFWYSWDDVGTQPGAIFGLFRIPGGGGMSLSTVGGLISANQWSHVAMTFDYASQTGFLYVNGVNVASNNYTGPGILVPQTAIPVNIGYRPDTSNELYPGQRHAGKLDEVSIYNRALSPNEIAAIYNAGSEGKCLAPPPPPPSCDPAPTGIVAWWPAEGNANDIVGGNNGSPVGALGYANDAVGQAFSFSGSNYVSVPDAPALNPTNAITVECWLYRQSVVASFDAVVKKNGQFGVTSNNGYSLEFNGDNLLFWIYSDTSGWQSSGGSVPIQLGQWYHVAGVYDGAHLLLYVNGVLAASSSTTGSIVPSVNSLCIGDDPVELVRYFHGLIDEVSIYNRALSPNEIAAIYNAGSAGKCNAQTAPVADATATSPVVISVNGINATVTLDGSKSYDLHGVPLQYTWLAGSNNVIASGVVAAVTLPVGVNAITLSVSDGELSDSQMIPVTVLTISQAINRLIAKVNQDAPKQKSLVALLSAALASIDKSHLSAVNLLQTFQNKVNVQIGPIDPVLALSLYNDAQAIIDAINGSGGGHGKASVKADKANGKPNQNSAGNSGQIYVIEASSDMVHWKAVGVANNQGNGAIQFDNSQLGQSLQPFYRVVVP